MDSKTQPPHGKRPAPPLPPRQPSSAPADAPPAYDSIVGNNKPYSSWSAGNDPRASSSDSLTPSDDNTAEDLQHQPHPQRRRKLLCIYVHGFMGNETSFRSFPAHVHNLLAVLLSDSHAVHTKIYPRYRSRRNIQVARDDFSKWLEPHEGENTDVVLLGHSMGGLVCAEVALMPSPTSDRALKHRIVGTVNFDVPFLGMHPGVVKSGLASIFSSPPEEPADKWENTQLAADADGEINDNGPQGKPPGAPSKSDGLWRPESSDPNFNPSFQNDVQLPVRKGWRNAWHFVSKHSDNLGKATKQLVTSHMEFGGAMANYSELKARYGRIRALEEDSDQVRNSVVEGGTPPRVRFVNYYTASTGRPKKPKPDEEQRPEGVGETASLDITENRIEKDESTTQSSHSVEQQASTYSQDDELYVSANEDSAISSPEMRHIDPTPADDSSDASPEAAVDTPYESRSPTAAPSTTASSMMTAGSTASLPPIPDPPTAPSPLEVSYIEDKQTRKLVEKEHARAMKAYEQAVKERERIIRDRAKLEEKRERKERKDSQKAEKDAHKARAKAEKEDGKQVKKMIKTDENRELTHSEREEKRLADERERMEKEGRRMRGEPEPDAREVLEEKEEQGTSPDQEYSHPTIASTTSPPSETSRSSSNDDGKDSKRAKPPKERKFCMLPPKDSQGQRDPCWPRVLMKDVDEVGAHCGLFFVDERYERLVGDVSERIEGWVKNEGGIEAGLERMRMKS